MQRFGTLCRIGVLSLCSAIALGLPQVRAQQVTDDKVRPGPHALGGIVTSANGPEAGVWVIAETVDLPSRMIEIVVTDDHGRYIVPDLPEANYSVWVRGFGLVDSPKVEARPGRVLDLTAAPAPSAAAAAEYYPAIFWYSMLKIPPAGEFPGTGTEPGGNGIQTDMKS